MNNKTPVRAATTCMLFLALSFQQEASGYEIRTHARMSREAALQAANLTGNLENLGLSSLFDEVSQGGSTKKALEWIEEGAEREDDTLSEVFARYRNHFYDPISGRGFGGILWRDSGFISGMPAPDWALDKGAADGQLYSFRQARQYLFDGLTQPTKADRERSLALMFHTLGNVVHVVQDMAQPQHTRNDGHGDGSLYELYTDEKRNSLSYSGAAIPSFSKARDLFANSSGSGLAQYSNGNFVSAGTNFRYQNGQMLPSGNYAYPTPGPNIQSVSVQDLDVSPLIKTFCGQDPACNMRFVSGTNDRGETHGRTATLSIFYDDLEQYNVTPPNLDLSPYFSLNRFNFDAAHPDLIPRAVAYSAGLMDYFFRGKMDIVCVETPDYPGLFVINNMGPEDMTGTFSLYYDDIIGVRRLVPGAAWRFTIPANGQSPKLTFERPTSPPPADVQSYILVFEGDMGQETQTAIAAGVAASVPFDYEAALNTSALWTNGLNYEPGYISGTYTSAQTALEGLIAYLNNGGDPIYGWDLITGELNGISPIVLLSSGSSVYATRWAIYTIHYHSAKYGDVDSVHSPDTHNSYIYQDQQVDRRSCLRSGG